MLNPLQSCEELHLEWKGCPICGNPSYNLYRSKDKVYAWYNLEYKCIKCGSIYDRRKGYQKRQEYDILEL